MASADVGEVRPTVPLAGVPRTAWQAPQPWAKRARPERGERGCWVGARTGLMREPAVEVGAGSTNDVEDHERVRLLAVLRAHAAEDAVARRAQREARRGRPANMSSLPPGATAPRRVDDVGAVGARGVGGFSPREVELVGELDVAVRGRVATRHHPLLGGR